MTVLRHPTFNRQTSDSRTYTAPELVARSGITYRQFDYWVRTGLLTPEARVADGSGFPRRFTGHQVAYACLMKRLLDGGLALRPAAAHATALLETGQTTIAGLTVHLPEEL